MQKIATALLCFVFLLAACSAQNEPEAIEPTLAVPVVVAATATAWVPTSVAPTEVPPTAMAAETAVSNVDVVEPTVAALAETAVASADVVEPTVVVEPTPETVMVNVVAGRTDEGAFFLGNPNAPLTVIDYSDFL